MQPLRYSINVTLGGCCDHRAIPADEELHRHAIENLEQADALLFGRVTYEMMEAAFRPQARTGTLPDWMEPFARSIDAAKKYVASSTLDRVDWNAELVRGDLGKAVQQLKQELDAARSGGPDKNTTLPLRLRCLAAHACHRFRAGADRAVRPPGEPAGGDARWRSPRHRPLPAGHNREGAGGPHPDA